MAHLAASIAAPCMILVIALFSQGFQFSDGSSGVYTKSQIFSDKLYNDSMKILNAVRYQEYLGDTDVPSDRIVDIAEIQSNDSLTYKNTSGFAYSLKDLQNWYNSSGSYWHSSSSDNSIVVCEKPDHTYVYYTFEEFSDLYSRQLLEFTYSIDRDTSYDSLEALFLALRYSQYTEAQDFNIKSVKDTQKNVTYTNLWSYTGKITEEKYSPDGYESILDMANNEPNWNGRLEEAYDALDDALGKVGTALNSARLLEDYKEGNTNLTYLFISEKANKVFSNKASYQSNAKAALDEMQKQELYLIMRPTLSESETSLSGIDLSMWQEMITSHSGYTDDFVFAITVDEKFPIQDTLASQKEDYEKYAPLGVPSMASIGLCAVVFVLILGILTAAAGKKASDSHIYLSFFDKWFTEPAAGLVIGIWILGIAFSLEIMDCQNSVDALAVWSVLLALFTCAMFLIGYLSLVRRIKAKNLWKNSFLRWLLLLIKKLWTVFLDFYRELAKNMHSVLKMILVVGVFLFTQFALCGIIFSGGAGCLLFLAAIDIAAMYYFLKRANGWQKILDGLRKITGGDLQYKIPVEKLAGEQLTIAESINSIGDGLNKAVENSVKNERMKTELITNVSHDIKTPLTSIINYIDLLKRENLDDPKIQGYIEILEAKAQRLKVLTEDVVEASKASTGNISLEMADLNFVEMINQVMGEFEEKFEQKRLTMVVNLPTEPVFIRADGRRLWRVLENLFNNAAKYAMQGTRVYVDLQTQNQQADLCLKNISAQPLNFSADELTERFIRGDVSRNTEGSGLGLSIAKSLTTLQGGEFTLYLDGDLFKVVISFRTR